MSPRKRPLTETTQPQNPRYHSQTPSRTRHHAPSTPHAIRAHQQQSGGGNGTAKSQQRLLLQRTIHRSTARKVPSQNDNTNNNEDDDDDDVSIIRPDSIRGILKQFARITAPVTERRVVTPTTTERVGKSNGKENRDPDDDEEEEEGDSILGKRPYTTFAIEESLEGEDDSEVLVAPDLSLLPDDGRYGSGGEDGDEPTSTFHGLHQRAREGRAMSEKIDRRRSLATLLGEEDVDGEEQVGNDEEGDDEQDGDATIITERGRRALSEEFTGRLSRYSFGSIRMSDFGSELEVRRQSDRQGKTAEIEDDGGDDDYVMYNNDDGLADIGGETEALANLQRSPSASVVNDDSVQMPEFGDETFRLQMPDEDEVAAAAEHTNANGVLMPTKETVSLRIGNDDSNETNIANVAQQPVDLTGLVESPSHSRRQTLLEHATTQSQGSRNKRLKLTRHGTMVPSLPTSLIKRIAIETQTKQGRRKPTLSRDHVKALEQATEWFFEQAGEDLEAYSRHGRRKKRIDTGDVELLMRRQKALGHDESLAEFAKEWLPKDVLETLDLSE